MANILIIEVVHFFLEKKAHILRKKSEILTERSIIYIYI